LWNDNACPIAPPKNRFQGRVALGRDFVNRTVMVEHRGDDTVIVRLASVIPEREAWLCENPKAMASVRRGLDQARKAKVTKNPPDLETAANLAAMLLD